MAVVLSLTIWNLGKNVQLEWSSFLVVGTIAKAKAWPFENWTFWILIFKKSRFQNVSGFLLLLCNYQSVIWMSMFLRLFKVHWLLRSFGRRPASKALLRSPTDPLEGQRLAPALLERTPTKSYSVPINCSKMCSLIKRFNYWKKKKKKKKK